MRVAQMIGSGVVAIVALGLGVLAVTSSGAPVVSAAGDMSVSGLIGLRLFDALLAAGAATASWSLRPRSRPAPPAP